MSALSYLGSRVALMVKVPPVPSSLADTFLVSGGAAIAFLHLPVELDGASSTIAQHSEEVRLPEWASELLPDLVFFFLLHLYSLWEVSSLPQHAHTCRPGHTAH